MIVLKEPQSHRWMLDDVLWYVNRDINRNRNSSNHCIVLRGDGLALMETRSGKILWTFHDPGKIEWGHSVRGCPATFQPDRCTVQLQASTKFTVTPTKVAAVIVS